MYHLVSSYSVEFLIIFDIFVLPGILTKFLASFAGFQKLGNFFMVPAQNPIFSLQETSSLLLTYLHHNFYSLTSTRSYFQVVKDFENSGSPKSVKNQSTIHIFPALSSLVMTVQSLESS